MYLSPREVELGNLNLGIEAFPLEKLIFGEAVFCVFETVFLFGVILSLSCTLREVDTHYSEVKIEY